MIADRKPHPFDGGKCQVPMFSGGSPDGFCGQQAFGEQAPQEVWHPILGNNRRPYCLGPCCPMHGGPKETGVRFFADGTGPTGRRMWCAVMDDFTNLQESPAGFDENADWAQQRLMRAIAAEATAATA